MNWAQLKCKNQIKKSVKVSKKKEIYKNKYNIIGKKEEKQ